ncbi:hypothetical protein SAMN05216562_0807 [Microbulbifer marinus]|uniref:Uncharacterized protein n=2 Tax=Microbulbifer marinus TaxID=658218 RepID=A0A1H3WF89_9GAMM|nr:hypothetical protein SAMN05216562_0807 [Microbulbifer marinus]
MKRGEQMDDRIFPILGTTIAPLIGRKALVGSVENALKKRTPDHIQVVGARFSGKTVLLNEIARYFQEEDTTYTATFFWDLGHCTPQTDEQFIIRFTEKLTSALKKNHPDLSEYLHELEDVSYQEIAEVLEVLKEENGKVLAILDGFDRPLLNGQLTRNLWDQLRELAIKPSLRFVTASRRSLRELIRQPDAQTSDFWNIFAPNPVRVGCFDEDDLDDALTRLSHVSFTRGALTEIWNSTNGFPLMVLETLNCIADSEELGNVTDVAVRDACQSAYSSLYDPIDTLWGECSSAAQEVFRRIESDNAVATTDVSDELGEALISRGFVARGRGKLFRANRLLCKYLSSQNNEDSAMFRLFGKEGEYNRHFRTVLELRISQLESVDGELKRYLMRGVEDMPLYPSVFLANIRGIANHAFELIWDAELSERKIPSDWISTWRYNGERDVDDFTTSFPKGGRRLRLLNLMTGSDRSSPVTKWVGKDTYELMCAVHRFGDFGQHQEDSPVGVGTAYAALHLCVELAAKLGSELSGDASRRETL